MSRKSYPRDVSDGEWKFVMPYLCLMSLDVPQRQHHLREIFNAFAPKGRERKSRCYSQARSEGFFQEVYSTKVWSPELQI